MNASGTAEKHAVTNTKTRGAFSPTTLSPVIQGNPLAIGSGFTALAYREKDFSGAMDPLVMVDHYRMTEPTFGPHPHAGLSAVSVLFEDSEGPFHNRDTLGNDFDLTPGDLYWLKAGSGVIHDESPRAGAKIHGLQVFVNLPLMHKASEPESLHVKASSVPVYKSQGSRVRVLLGSSNGIIAEQSPAIPMTILDGKVNSNGHFSHGLNSGENAWLVAIKGELNISVSGQDVHLSAGQSIAISPVDNSVKQIINIANNKDELAHFALFAAKPFNEAFVQKGPFVMSSEAEIKRIEADYTSGKLGKLGYLE